VAGFGERPVGRPPAGSHPLAGRVDNDDIQNIAGGPAFIDNRLHRGIIMLSQRSGQGCIQHRVILRRLGAGLVCHGIVQQTQAVENQYRKHQYFYADGKNQQTATDSIPGGEPLHLAPLFRTFLTSLA
jgi:hypothetical protein